MADLSVARARGIEGFERHVVIKHLRPEQSEDEAFVKMFVTEARLAGALHHHNIVQVHDIGQEDGRHFFAMEYVHGEDLRRLLSQLKKCGQRPPLEHVITIISAVAAALHHAHEQKGPDRRPLGIVHRDVTPGNILVAYDGNVKVVDFGIAKAALGTPGDTQVGMLKGKVPYMAPEQCTGKPVDRRSDVFALGIVLYELATVRRLFQGGNEFYTMSAVISGDIPPPSKHRPDLPKALEDIMLKALARKPSDRYQSADELRAALEGFAEQARLRTSASALASYMKQLFGERPEPWMADEPVRCDEYDDTEPGVVTLPSEVLEKREIPKSVVTTRGSLIEQARLNAISSELKLVQPPRVAKPKLPMPSVRSSGIARGLIDGSPGLSPRPPVVPYDPIIGQVLSSLPAAQPARASTDVEGRPDLASPQPWSDRTDVASPPPPPISIVATTPDREATEVVTPLPMEGRKRGRPTSVLYDDSPRRRIDRKWLIAGGFGAVALAVAVILVMNRSSNLVPPAQPEPLDMKANAAPAQPDPEPSPAPVVAKPVPAPEPAPVPAPAPAPAPTPEPQPQVATTPAPSPEVADPPPAPRPPVVTEGKPSPRPILRKPAAPKPVVKTSKVSRTTKPSQQGKSTKPPAWDPDALFLKKK